MKIRGLNNQPKQKKNPGRSFERKTLTLLQTTTRIVNNLYFCTEFVPVLESKKKKKKQNRVQFEPIAQIRNILPLPPVTKKKQPKNSRMQTTDTGDSD